MKIMAYASRPLPDFNKYEALEMLESLQLTAQDTKHDHQNFYRLVYQTVRGKLDVPRDQFRSLVLRLLGDKDHEKIFDCVVKVEKHYRLRDRARTAAVSPYYREGRERNVRDFPRNPGRPMSCFYCGRLGHIKRFCEAGKRDLSENMGLQKNGTSPASGAK